MPHAPNPHSVGSRIPHSPSPNMFVKLTVNFLVVRLYNKDY